MVGIGITTMNRPHCLNALLESIYKHTDMSNVLLHIEDDSGERLGVAKRKNRCLRALKDCSHVFLLDDDVKIIKDGWIEFFVNSGKEHLLFLNDKLHNKWEHQPMDKTVLYRDCGGVFMFMTKAVIERVGAFNEKFDLYSFEHAEYSIRILSGHRIYPMLKGTEQYIYAEDYSNLNHKSSISDEEKQKCIKNNWDKFFNSEIKTVYLPL